MSRKKPKPPKPPKPLPSYKMATPVYITGFECGCNPTTNGLGLWDAVNGSPVVDSSIKRTGDYSLKIVAPGGGTAYFCRKNYGTQQKVGSGTFYFYIPTGGLPSANTVLAGFTFTTATVAAGIRVTTGGTIGVQVGGGTVGGNASFSLDAWHRIDFKIDVTASTWTLDWSLDGATQTQGTLTGQSTTDSIRAFRFGSNNTTATYTIYFDDAMFTESSGDYPIGNLAVERLVPSADGTHNAGTNTMEAQDGTDIGSTPAYNKLNSVPTSSTTYVRQVTIGTGNYAEVEFNDLVASASTIHGASAILAYSSETTSANKGGCIISKDAFSTKTVVWGEAGALQDYSDGNTSNPYWKTAIVAGVTDLTTVNALKARIGYSDDVTPNPYWLDMMVEVAYVPSSDITLDLVTFTSTPRDITILENVVVSLDLVTYTSTPRDITILESIPVPLDLVSYSSSFPDLTILENVVIVLDLTSYSSSFPALTVVENELIPLDSVGYSSSFPDLTILENEVILFETVYYVSTSNDLELLENELIVLDPAVYSSSINDLTILESEIVVLDLVTYSSTVYDTELLTQDMIGLDAVTYSYTFPDLVVLEQESTVLETVYYARVYQNIELLEQSDIALDLVTYSSIFNDAIMIDEAPPIRTPRERVYVIGREVRICGIEYENRVFSVNEEIRIIN